jgi:hypothetical protein
VEETSPKIFATSVIFKKTNRSKQSHKRRKFAQSGHPAFKAPKSRKEERIAGISDGEK